MKNLVNKILILMVVLAQSVPASAGREYGARNAGYKTHHGGFTAQETPIQERISVERSRRQRQLSQQVLSGIYSPQRDIVSFLDRGSQSNFALVNRTSYGVVRELQKRRENSRVQAENERLAATPIRAVNRFEAVSSNQVTPAFAQLGHMVQFHVPASEATELFPAEVAHDVILSGPVPGVMNHGQAEAYCQSLGRGARLPTAKEYEALSRAMGSRQPQYGGPHDVDGYVPNLVSGMYFSRYWTATVIHRLPNFGGWPELRSEVLEDEGWALYFDGHFGSFGHEYRSPLNKQVVRCVVDTQ